MNRETAKNISRTSLNRRALFPRLQCTVASVLPSAVLSSTKYDQGHY